MSSPAKSMPMLRLRARLGRPRRLAEQRPQLVEQRDVGHRQVAVAAGPGLGQRGSVRACGEPVRAGRRGPGRRSASQPSTSAGVSTGHHGRGEPLELVAVGELLGERASWSTETPSGRAPPQRLTSARRASGPAGLGCCTRPCSWRAVPGPARSAQPQHLAAVDDAQLGRRARRRAPDGPLQEPAHPQRALERGQRRRVEPVARRRRPRSAPSERSSTVSSPSDGSTRST